MAQTRKRNIQPTVPEEVSDTDSNANSSFSQQLRKRRGKLRRRKIKGSKDLAESSNESLVSQGKSLEPSPSIDIKSVSSSTDQIRSIDSECVTPSDENLVDSENDPSIPKDLKSIEKLKASAKLRKKKGTPTKSTKSVKKKGFVTANGTIEVITAIDVIRKEDTTSPTLKTMPSKSVLVKKASIKNEKIEPKPTKEIDSVKANSSTVSSRNSSISTSRNKKRPTSPQPYSLGMKLRSHKSSHKSEQQYEPPPQPEPNREPEPEVVSKPSEPLIEGRKKNIRGKRGADNNLTLETSNRVPSTPLAISVQKDSKQSSRKHRKKVATKSPISAIPEIIPTDGPCATNNNGGGESDSSLTTISTDSDLAFSSLLSFQEMKAYQERTINAKIKDLEDLLNDNFKFSNSTIDTLNSNEIFEESRNGNKRRATKKKSGQNAFPSFKSVSPNPLTCHQHANTNAYDHTRYVATEVNEDTVNAAYKGRDDSAKNLRRHSFFDSEVYDGNKVDYYENEEELEVLRNMRFRYASLLKTHNEFLSTERSRVESLNKTQARVEGLLVQLGDRDSTIARLYRDIEELETSNRNLMQQISGIELDRAQKSKQVGLFSLRLNPVKIATLVQDFESGLDKLSRSLLLNPDNKSRIRSEILQAMIENLVPVHLRQNHMARYVGSLIYQALVQHVSQKHPLNKAADVTEAALTNVFVSPPQNSYLREWYLHCSDAELRNPAVWDPFFQGTVLCLRETLETIRVQVSQEHSDFLNTLVKEFLHLFFTVQAMECEFIFPAMGDPLSEDKMTCVGVIEHDEAPNGDEALENSESVVLFAASPYLCKYNSDEDTVFSKATIFTMQRPSQLDGLADVALTMDPLPVSDAHSSGDEVEMV